MQDLYERYRLSDYADQADAILHSILYEIDYKVQFHKHSYFEIFLVFSGGIFHEANGESRDIPCNSILFIRPHDMHRYRQNGDEPCGLIRLWISPYIFEALQSFLGKSSCIQRLLAEKLPPGITVTGMEMKSFLDRFEDIFSLSPEEEPRRVSSLKMLFVEIALLFTGQLAGPVNKSLPDWLGQLCRDIAIKDNLVLGIDRLFELSNRSREHVSRSFKNYLGTTPTDYIKHLRLNYAANQLANTNRKIVDICYESGFGNLSYFYECFKAHYGMTPSSYRASKLTLV